MASYLDILKGGGALLEGAGSLYGAYAASQANRALAKQQENANALAQKNFGLAEQSYRNTLARQAAGQSAMEEGLANSPYGILQQQQQQPQQPTALPANNQPLSALAPTTPANSQIAALPYENSLNLQQQSVNPLLLPSPEAGANMSAFV